MYRLVAADVLANGYTYAAKLTGSPATIAAGMTAAASASYLPTTGSLRVTIATVDGITPSVEVRNASNAVVQTFSAAGTTTLAGLPPGSYRLLAADIAAGGYSYAATLTGSPTSVIAGQTVESSATYAATTGSLAVTVTAVDGITPSVEVRDDGDALVRRSLQRERRRSPASRLASIPSSPMICAAAPTITPPR